jgi:hypothetical protein
MFVVQRWPKLFNRGNGSTRQSKIALKRIYFVVGAVNVQGLIIMEMTAGTEK